MLRIAAVQWRHADVVVSTLDCCFNFPWEDWSVGYWRLALWDTSHCLSWPRCINSNLPRVSLLPIPWERGCINRYQKTFRECVVPENIHTPPTEVFFFVLHPPPPEKFQFSFILYACKILAFKTPPPPRYFQWPSIGWVGIFSGTTQS